MMPRLRSSRPRSKESGYVLLAVMLTLMLMLVALAVAAPRIAQQIKRDKEEELVHRGKDYATAIKRFVHKNGGRYPTSVEQLENTNHIRFLRKKYIDPMTGESEWKMVHVGEAQINIPAPNPGLSGGGGTNPGLSGGGTGLQTNPPGGVTPPTGTGGTGTGGTGTGGTGTGPTGLTNTLTTTNIGNGQTVGGGQIMGVASVNKNQAIKEFNDKDHYNEWYFVYDLRLEQSGGTGVTVAAPRAGGAVTGTSGSPGAGSAAGATGSQNPPTDSGQPPQAGTPTPSPTPSPVPN